MRTLASNSLEQFDQDAFTKACLDIMRDNRGKDFLFKCICSDLKCSCSSAPKQLLDSRKLEDLLNFLPTLLSFDDEYQLLAAWKCRFELYFRINYWKPACKVSVLWCFTYVVFLMECFVVRFNTCSK